MHRVAMIVIALLVATGAFAQSSWKPEPFQPTQGMWWSSAQPGTGLAFNIDDEGRWFAALYLYSEDGEPSFLTMQGESLEYTLNFPPGVPYAFAISPLIVSNGGQCLRCPWRAAGTTDSGLHADLVFLSRNKAELRVGNWTLDLLPLPLMAGEFSDRALPVPDHYYSIIIEGPVGRHVATVAFRTDDDPVAAGRAAGRIECVDCRTIDSGGNASDAQDTELRAYVEALEFRCLGDHCLIAGDDFLIRLLSDSAGTELAAFDPGDSGQPPRFPTRIEMRHLGENWVR